MSLPTYSVPLSTIPTHRSIFSTRSNTIPLASFPSRGAQTSIPRSLRSVSLEKRRDEEETTASDHAAPSPKRPAGRRRITEAANATADKAEQEGTKTENLNFMGRLYKELGNYSVASRYALYIVPVALLIMIPVVVGATAASDARIGGVRLVWFFTWIEAVWLVLWAMKFVARAIPLIFGFFAGVVSSGSKKYVRILSNLENTIMVLGWVIISFVLFEVLFETSASGNTPDRWTTVAKQILASILIATIIFTVEKIFVQMISVSYHARSFNRKIIEAKEYVALMAIMLDASLLCFPMYCDDFIDEDLVIGSGMEAFLRKEAAAQRAHGTTVRGDHIINGLGRMGRYANRIGGTVTSVFGNIAAELTGKEVLSPRSANSIVIESLERTKSAKALARRLWLSFVVEGQDELTIAHVEDLLGPDRHDLARECFSMLDVDNNEDVSLDEMILRITEICLSRKAVAKSMHDVSQAIKALDSVLSAVALLISVFVLVSFLDTGFSSILSTTSTTLLSLSFVFSPTAQEFLGSCIFLFVKHAYDISDRVDIQGNDGKNRLIVDQISLLYTAFRRVDDMELVQVPNIILNSLWINNITRSNTYLERIDLYINFDTKIEQIEQVRQEMQDFVRIKDNRREFQPDILLRVISVGSMDKLQLQLEYRHKSNWSVENIRAARHSKFMCALILVLRKLGIFGPGVDGMPVLGEKLNPAYNVSISDEQAKVAKEKATADAATVAMTEATTDPDATSSEANAAQQSEAVPGSALAAQSEVEASKTMNAFNYIDELRADSQDDINIDGSRGTAGSSGIRRASLNKSEDGTQGNVFRRRSSTPASNTGGRRQAGVVAGSILSGTRSRIEEEEPGEEGATYVARVESQAVSEHSGRIDR